MNSLIISGTVSTDPDIRYNARQEPVVSFKIKSGRKMKDTWTNYYVLVTCFGGLAKAAATGVHKGDKIIAIGEMETTSWENKEGKTVWQDKLIVRELGMRLYQDPKESSATKDLSPEEEPF